MSTPCKGCQKRYYGCHQSCQDYGKFKEERSKMIEQRKKEYAEYDFLKHVKYNKKAR